MNQRKSHMCYGGDCPDESHYAEGGAVGSGTSRWANERGINRPSTKQGQSVAGSNLHPAFSIGGKKWDTENAKDSHRQVLDQMKSMKKPELYAEGGEAAYKSGYGSRDQDFQSGVHSQAARGSIGTSTAGAVTRRGGDSKPIHKENLAKLKGMEKPKLYAEGGDVDDEETHPMVSKVMMSRGGMIANEDEPEADSMPAEFDDLALDDHLEGTNSGAADGDEIGDEQETDDRHDIVAKILSSRKKKDRMPRPA
jgi:hypothetical protein